MRQSAHDLGRGARDSSEQIDQVIQALPLPFVLINIDTLTVEAVSVAAVQIVGGSPADLVGRPLLDLIVPEDRENASRLNEVVRSGALHSFVISARPVTGPVTVWARLIDLGSRRYELAWLSTDPAGQFSPLKQYLGSEPAEMTVGTVDSEWRILTISSEAERILGTPADAMVGMRLVARMPQADVDNLVAARELVAVAHSVALKISWPVDGELRELTCFLSRPVGIRDLGFMLTPEVPVPPGQEHRTAELERHLVKIAAEVEASGVLDRFFALPDPADLPELQHLSVRQWEIMSRLLQGERVPEIAKELFLSQSTVRNHLSMIYRRFDVHSQAELLALLANRRPRSAQN